jgi:hypothetical protein
MIDAVVERLEQVFEKLDEEPQEREHRVLDAMIDEHDDFAEDNDGEVLDRYNISAGQKIEHYEIAGCHVVGPEAATVIHEVRAAVGGGADAGTLAETIHVHPVVSEVVQDASSEAWGVGLPSL